MSTLKWKKTTAPGRVLGHWLSTGNLSEEIPDLNDEEFEMLCTKVRNLYQFFEFEAELRCHREQGVA